MDPATRPRGCILVVEDEELPRKLLAQTLEAEGFTVAQAANGREAINYLHTNPKPGLILLDLRMPVMNGWEFRHRQKQDPELASIPVVVCSGAGDVREEAALVGAEHYLQKPVSREHLLEVVGRYYH